MVDFTTNGDQNKPEQQVPTEVDYLRREGSDNCVMQKEVLETRLFVFFFFGTLSKGS